MEPAIWAALIAGAAGVVTGGLGLYDSRAQARREGQRQERITRLEHELVGSRTDRERQLRAETVLARYRNPLIAATFELQDRLQNLLRPAGQSVLVYLRVEDRAELAIRSTLFRFAQYFGWTEVIRREVEFLDLEATSATRTVQDAIGSVARVFAADEFGLDFMLWREEQRAIGEQMLSGETGSLGCIGFASFEDRYDDGFERWLGRIAATLRGSFERRRLVELHHVLIDLGMLLDPDEVRYSWGEWDFRSARYKGPDLDLDTAARA
jgi:hypothetical protein